MDSELGKAMVVFSFPLTLKARALYFDIQLYILTLLHIFTTDTVPEWLTGWT